MSASTGSGWDREGIHPLFFHRFHGKIESSAADIDDPRLARIMRAPGAGTASAMLFYNVIIQAICVGASVDSRFPSKILP